MQHKTVTKHVQGRKTHEQQLRTLHNEPGVPDARQMEAALATPPDGGVHLPKRGTDPGEFTITRGGNHQESRHNKPAHDDSI